MKKLLSLVLVATLSVFTIGCAGEGTTSSDDGGAAAGDAGADGAADDATGDAGADGAADDGGDA